MSLISSSEYAARRARVLDALNGSAAVVFAGEGHAPLLGRWHANKNFVYLTGITSEPGAALLFDPSAPDPERQVTLFLRPINPEADVWDGLRDPIGAPLREKYGISHVMRTGALNSMLSSAARRCKKLACLAPFAVPPSPVSPDLALYRQVAERVLGVSIEDRTQLLILQRAQKSDTELMLMRKAAQATIDGYAAALEVIRPGGSETEVARALTTAFEKHGGEHAYNPIVGSGINACVFHYMENSAPLNAGDVVLIDAGAAIGGYAADVTRTYPVSGTLTPEQQSLYSLVRDSMDAAIATLKPGSTLMEADKAARAVFTKAGYLDPYPYSIGHPLGLDVHEAGPDGGLLEGMVVTIEPGIYLLDKKLGIRIEDDLLITANGSENLTGVIRK
ncbi:MAG: Xaa-Pro peptidase family protein [Armatimonas sp.]